MTTSSPFFLDQAAVLAALPDVVLVLDAEANVCFANDAVRETLGLALEDWQGRSVLDLIHPDDIAVVVSSMGTVQGKQRGSPVEVRVRDNEQSWRWMEVVGADRLEVDTVRGIVCVARDITSRRMWEVAGGDMARFQQVVQHASSITLLLDANGEISSVNGAFTRLLGHDPSLVIGRSLAAFASAAGAARLRPALERLITTGVSFSLEVPMKVQGKWTERNLGESDQRERPMRFEFVNLLDDPVVAGIVVTGHDVSDLEVARQELEFLAHHDALTGLANRSLLLETMRCYVESGRPLSVIFLDLDRFKPVNDLFGHEAGDELLRIVADRLRSAIRPGDLVARVGGDEFVVVAPGITGRTAAAALGARIDAALAEPYMLMAGPVRIGASIGIAVSDAESTVTGLLADADLNMYDIKADRRGEEPRPMAERRRSAVQRRRLADDLAAGLRRGELVAHLQPIVDLENQRVVSYEALARWVHPTLGLLPPSTFIDLAEDADLGVELGLAIAQSACAAMERIFTEVPASASAQLALNLSVAQLSDPTLAQQLQQVLDRHGFDFPFLVVEVTERATLSRGAASGAVPPEETLHQLRGLGADLSLDDFGTGHSSLTHVRRYSLQQLKIDRSFVSGMLEHPEDHAVVSAVVGLGHALGIRVVAEGIEHQSEVDALRALGCHEGQGYLLGKPMSHEDVIVWAREHQASISRVLPSPTPASAGQRAEWPELAAS